MCEMTTKKGNACSNKASIGNLCKMHHKCNNKHESSCPLVVKKTKEEVLANLESIDGKDIIERHKVKSERETVYSALREIQQKRVMKDKVVVQFKNRCIVIENGKKMFRCKSCEEIFPFLTAAHIGVPMSRKIHQILDANIDEFGNFGKLSLYELDKKVIEIEKESKIVVVCRDCNKLVED